MFAFIRTLFRLNLAKNKEENKNSSSLLLVIFVNLLEDVLFWKKIWLSVLFFLFFNILFFFCVYQQMNLLQIILSLYILIAFADAFETWLRSKHRTSCLKRLICHDNKEIKLIYCKIKSLLFKVLIGFIYLRYRNHTKAFLLLQIILGFMLFIGKYTGGYALVYLLCTMSFFMHKLAPLLTKILKKIHQCSESELELEDLVPEESELNLKLLAIEVEPKPVFDERQSLDYWKPEDLPLEASDSSDESSSLVTNLSTEKLQTLSKDVEITDSSEDEYVPQDQHEEPFKSSLEIQPSGTWSGTAYNVLSNFGGAVANIIYKKKDDKEKRRKRVSSLDSDSFEMIDKNELQ